MIYTQIKPGIHLILKTDNRFKINLESLYTCGGSWYENPQDRGKKHLLEHCLVARTKTMDFEEFKNYQFKQNYNLNAATSPSYMYLEMSGHHSNWQNMIDLLVEMTTSPTFDQTILDQEKEIVLREIAERTGEPSYQTYYYARSKIFTPESLYNHQTLGEAELVSQTSLQDFEKLHRQNLSDGHLIFTLSGGFEQQATVEYLEKALSKVPSTALAAFNKPNKEINFEAKSEFQKDKELAIIHKLAHKHVEINFYLPFEISFNQEPKNRIFRELFLNFHGALYDKLRNKEGLIYSMYNEYNKSLQHLYLNMSCESQHVVKIISSIKEVFSNFGEYFNPEMFTNLKETLIKKAEIASDSPAVMANFSQNSLLEYGVAESYPDFLKRLAKVTMQDIEQIYTDLQKNWENRRIYIVSRDAKVKEIPLKEL